MPNIQITPYDFDAIKASLKTFLQSQDTFTDYDFEGSALSTLLDILSVNTHYNAYLANMLANEMFLDSAVKRESAVSIAKHLSYTPRSTLGAKATVNIVYASQPGSPSSLTIPRYSGFTTTINGIAFSFVNLEPESALNVDNTYTFENVELTEGVPVVNTFVVRTPGPAEKYVLTNKNVDITSLRVLVQQSELDSSTTTYTRAVDLSGSVNATEIRGDDNIFFVEENPQGKYEIFFGDGNIGSLLSAGNIVYVYYVASSGEKTNVSSTITQSFTGPTLNGISPTITTVENSNGGKEKETTEEIRFNAPRAYAAQNRAVTEDDYKSIIQRDISNVKAVAVWGGETASPPQYGKVFISILPTSGNAITPQQKTRIKETIIGSKRVVAIQPEIVDPDLYYVNLATTVKYDNTRTILTSNQIRSLVETKINSYFDTNLDKFSENFIYSKLSKEIDSASSAIIGNQTIVKIQKRFVPSLVIGNNNKLTFNNTLAEYNIQSTRFIYNQNGTLVHARIRDVPDASTVSLTGTYRRSGSVITCTFTSPHTMTVGEEISLDFISGSATTGTYEVYRVLSDYSFTVVSTITGSTSGTVEISSNPRGSLALYNASTGATILTNVGFVNYLEGIVQFNTLYVAGFPVGISDIKVTCGLVEGSLDLITQRNQILRLDSSSAQSTTNQLAGLTITVVAV